MNGAAYTVDGRPASREAFYAVACDARRHVCVEACAGAGKTWMLVARIVRALLDGAQPQEILAITFTRKAAGEMRTRLADWLREASAMTRDQAVQRLREFGLPADEAQARAYALIGLHERVLDSGREVDVHTMHAWFARLLAAAPIELLAGLGLAPGLTPLEETGELMPALMQRLHAHLLTDDALRADHRRLSLRFGRARLVRWLTAALERRNEIELAHEAGVLGSSVAPGGECDPLDRLRSPAFIARAERTLQALQARTSYRKDAELAAARVREALARRDTWATFERLREALFNDEGRARSRLGDATADLCAELDDMLTDAQQQIAHDDHAAMSRLSLALFAHYARLKRDRALVDMNDLERVALALLSEHDLSAWVQQRLDARVRHLLIDEFQDTSPLQWHALQSWLAAYAGAGGGASAPRVFIVGDPKQSIYRFRRAEPRLVEAAQQFVVEALGGSVVACDHTRRCAPGVVALVNRVFGQWEGDGGLPGWRDHTTEVAHDTAWPVVAALPSTQRPAAERRSAGEEERIWRPSLTAPRSEPLALLRDSEADEVARAIEHLVRVEGVLPDEILVLARRNAVLAHAAEALAAHHVPHVAPEDLLLAELPEVQDLLAVLDVLASPTQALSLARALKSPLMGADDADLLDLARRAREAGGWWSALMRCGDDVTAALPLQRAARLFERWAVVAPTLPPHDLLDRIVHEGELLPRLVAVAPPARRVRALDAVRALLAAALELDGGRYASAYTFVRALRSRRVQAPASQQEGAVRLLTIHGAKGLEAQVVFLIDTEPAPASDEGMAVWVEWPPLAARPTRVAFVASAARCPPSLRALREEEDAAAAREEANALYVALTRARARLFVSRTPPHRTSARRSWWERLAPAAQPWQAPDSRTAESDPAQAAFRALAWPVRPPPQPTGAAARTADEATAALGQAVHRTLEWAARTDATADLGALAEAAARAFPPADALAVRAIASRVLDSPDCRLFFDPAAIDWAGSEVAVASADGQPRRIDRLVRLRAPHAGWWVLDYKLSGKPQDDPLLVSQLAAYRDAVATLVPGEAVRAAFITGRGERIELPS